MTIRRPEFNSGCNLHPMISNPTRGRRSRLEALDGLRGVVIILVVLGHLSAFLWPVDGVRSTPFLRGLVGGGAVAAFYVISGFIVTNGLLGDQDRQQLDPARFLARRVVRVGTQVAVLCIALLVVRGVDATDTNSWSTTITSVTHTLTYTINWLLLTAPASTRPDMGHLWFVAIQQQWYLVLPLLLVVLGHRRRWIGAILVVGAAACAMYRLVTVADDTWFRMSVDTFARADALMLGMALAVFLPLLTRLSGRTGFVAGAALALMFVLLAVNREFGSIAFLGPWSIAFNLASLILVAALILTPDGVLVTNALTWSPLAWLGRASLVIYVWHYPLIFWVGRHVEGNGTPQTLVVLAMLAVISVVCHRWIEEPVRRWLSTHLRPPSHPEPVEPTPPTGDSTTSPEVSR
jgi:peptidoglycan/LPS O-acetylase OafA/YrhL